MPDQKTIRTSCPGGFSVLWVPKLLFNLIKIRIFGPQKAKFCPKLAFLAIYWHFWPIWADQMTMRTVMWVPKLLLSPLKIEIFPKNDQIWPEIGIFGHFGPGFASSFGEMLVGWLVVVALRLYLFTL